MMRVFALGWLAAALLNACVSGGAGDPHGWQTIMPERAAVRLASAAELRLHGSMHRLRSTDAELVEHSYWGSREGPHASIELRAARAMREAQSASPRPIADEVFEAWSKTTTVSIGRTGRGENRLGAYEYCRFSAAPERSCVYVRQRASNMQSLLRGWFCTAPAAELSERSVQTFLNGYVVDASTLAVR